VKPVVLVEGGDLGTSFQRTLRRSLISLTVSSLLATTAVIALPLSAGAAPSHAPRRVPNVQGLPRADVYAMMRKSSLYFRTIGPGGANGTWKSVTRVNPPPGTLVAWQATVTVTTSLSPAHAIRPVPRLAGLLKAQVFAAMRKSSLYFRTIGPGGANGTWVAAVGQSPSAGSMVRWHSTVVVTTTLVKPRPPAKSTVKRPRPTTTTTKPPKSTTTTEPATTSTSTTVPDSTTTTYPGETTTTSATTTSTTTTTTVPATTTTVKRAPVRYRIGIATWYSYFNGQCATSYLPMGTRITVRDLASGRAVSCVVTDRQASSSGRVVDLSATQFAQLMPLWRGVVRVKVSW
jgi:beta-lactam-binding protein with PASTA domain